MGLRRSLLVASGAVLLAVASAQVGHTPAPGESDEASDVSFSSDAGDLVLPPCMNGCDATLIDAMRAANNHDAMCAALAPVYDSMCMDDCKGAGPVEHVIDEYLEECSLGEYSMPDISSDSEAIIVADLAAAEAATIAAELAAQSVSAQSVHAQSVKAQSVKAQRAAPKEEPKEEPASDSEASDASDSDSDGSDSDSDEMPIMACVPIIDDQGHGPENECPQTTEEFGECPPGCEAVPLPEVESAFLTVSLTGAMMAGVLAAVAVTATVARRGVAAAEKASRKGDKTPLVPTDAAGSTAKSYGTEGETLL
jgi:hypothetical protein